MLISSSTPQHSDHLSFISVSWAQKFWFWTSKENTSNSSDSYLSYVFSFSRLQYIHAAYTVDHTLDYGLIPLITFSVILN